MAVRQKLEETDASRPCPAPANGLHASNATGQETFSGFYERGAITYKALFWLVVLFGIIYAGYKFAPPYTSYYLLKTEVEDEARLAHMYSDEKLRERIVRKAQTWKVPITWEDVEIKRGLVNISINIKYTKTISFPGDYKKKLEYSIMVTEPLRDRSGVLQ